MLVASSGTAADVPTQAASIDYGRTVLVFCFATMEQGRNKVRVWTSERRSFPLDMRSPRSRSTAAGLLALSRRADAAKSSKSALWLIPTCPTRTPSFSRITSPEARPCRRHRPRATRSLDRWPGSLYGGPGGALPVNWRRSLAYRQNVTLSPSRRPHRDPQDGRSLCDRATRAHSIGTCGRASWRQSPRPSWRSSRSTFLSYVASLNCSSRWRAPPAREA